MNAIALFLFSLATSAFASSDAFPPEPLPPGIERTNPGRACPNEVVYPMAIQNVIRSGGKELVRESIRLSPQMPENILKELGGVPLVAVYKLQNGKEWVAQFSINYDSCTVEFLNTSVLTRFDQ